MNLGLKVDFELAATLTACLLPIPHEATRIPPLSNDHNEMKLWDWNHFFS